MGKFEIELWPNPKKIKAIYMTALGVFVAAAIVFVLGNIFWTPENVHSVRKLGQSASFDKGWPVTMYWWGLFLMIAGFLSFVLVYFMQDKKNPVLGLNREGLYINQQMIKQTLVNWSDIARIDKKGSGNSVEMDIYFVDANRIIERQSGAKKAFLKENLKDGKPLSVTNKFSLGDLDALADKAKQYKG